MDHLINPKILVILIFLLNLRVIFGAAIADGVENVQLNIAIIGAGPGGLFSAKHSLALDDFRSAEKFQGILFYERIGISFYLLCFFK